MAPLQNTRSMGAPLSSNAPQKPPPFYSPTKSMVKPPVSFLAACLWASLWASLALWSPSMKQGQYYVSLRQVASNWTLECTCATVIRGPVDHVEPLYNGGKRSSSSSPPTPQLGPCPMDDGFISGSSTRRERQWDWSALGVANKGAIVCRELKKNTKTESWSAFLKSPCAPGSKERR